MKRLILIAILCCFSLGCTKKTKPLTESERVLEVRQYLFGGVSEQQYLRCSEDKQCRSGVCSFDHCTGMLIVHRRWIQRKIGDRLLARAAIQPALKKTMLRMLTEILADTGRDVMVRVRVIELLRRVPGAEVVAALKKARKDPQRALQVAAVLALANHGDRSTLADLKTMLKTTRNQLLKLELIKVLGRVGDKSVVPLLKEYLDDDSIFIQHRALQSLGRLKSKLVLLILVGVLANDDDDFLKFEAARSLRRLTGQRFGVRAAQWQKWLKSQR